MLPLIIGGIAALAGAIGGGIALFSGKEEEQKKTEAEIEERRRQEEEERRRREEEERRKREAEKKQIKVRNIVKISSDTKNFWRKDKSEASLTGTPRNFPLKACAAAPPRRPPRKERKWRCRSGSARGETAAPAAT